MKIRSDFVSNSSSCSFIIAATSSNPYETAYEMCKELGDSYEDTLDFFENYTSLTLCELHIHIAMIYDNTIPFGTFVPVGITVKDSELSEYFDGDEVRKDLDSLSIIRKLLWYKWDDSIDVFTETHEDKILDYSENGYVIYENRMMGKVNLKTYNFTKWLYEEIKKHGLNTFKNEPDRIDETLPRINKVKELLDSGKKLYQVRCSYSGDAERYGHIYIHDLRNSKPVYERLKDKNIVEDMWYVEV